jgi:hypothetical protein
MQKTRMFLLAITLAALFLSCNIINPSESIPAYIKVDTVLVKVTTFDQGSAKHNMSCVKINIAGTTLGFYELPVMAPCLITGEQSLYLEPAIELNGISGSRMVYPFYKPYTGTGKINLVQGEIITIVPETTYKTECKFTWMEDFEDAGVSFLYASYSDTTFRIQNEFLLEGSYSGAIYLDKTNKYFEAYSSTDFNLPKTGTPVLMEFDYKSNTLIEFGMYVLDDGAAIWTPIIYIRPSETWNRIYIDLNTTTTDNQNAELFRPGFRAGWDSTGVEKQSIFMDNLKLIHF